MSTKAPRQGYKKFLTTAIVVLMIVIGLGIWIYRNSTKSYPGNVFYPIKRQTEEILKIQNDTSTEKLNYEVKLADTRLVELKKVRDDLSKVKTLMADLNGNIDAWENDYSELAQAGNDEETFEHFEKLNLTIYSFLRTLEASKKTYADNKDFEKEIGEGSLGLRTSVDKLFEISANNMEDYSEFLKYATATFEQYQYPRVFRELQYVKEDFELVKSKATPEQKSDLQSKVDAFQAKYDELMKNRKDMKVKDIHLTLKELKKMEFEISMGIVAISNNSAETKPE
jgi:hypothetical protein